MSARSGVDPGVVDASVGSTLRYSIHPRRRRNLLVPLLCLPTELILKIFVHVITKPSLLLPLPPLCGDFPTVPPARVGLRPGFDNDPGTSNPIGG